MKSAVVLWTRALHIQTDGPSRFYHLYLLFLGYLLGIFSFVQIRFCFLEFAHNIFICLLNFISHLLCLLIFCCLQNDHLLKKFFVHFIFEVAYFSRNIIILSFSCYHIIINYNLMNDFKFNLQSDCFIF